MNNVPHDQNWSSLALRLYKYTAEGMQLQLLFLNVNRPQSGYDEICDALNAGHTPVAFRLTCIYEGTDAEVEGDWIPLYEPTDTPELRPRSREAVTADYDRQLAGISDQIRTFEIENWLNIDPVDDPDLTLPISYTLGADDDEPATLYVAYRLTKDDQVTFKKLSCAAETDEGADVPMPTLAAFGPFEGHYQDVACYIVEALEPHGFRANVHALADALRTAFD